MRWLRRRRSAEQLDEQETHVEDQPAPSLPSEGSEVKLAADEPILNTSQDLLARAPFARALARTVERAPRGSGFVIAVTGPWGDGKTSVLNMAASELKDRESVEIVRFNPWLFSGTEQLLGRFFAELAAQLPDDGGPLKAVSLGLRGYAEVVSPFRSLPLVGGVLEASGEAAQVTADRLFPITASVHERAAELWAALAPLARPIMITIDDIDRLRSDEIADVMRLVRLVGDFPNLIYVLAFERERVQQALGGGPERQDIGHDYLEKIVQAVFEMPAVQREFLERLLPQAISDAVGNPDRLTFSSDAYANVYAQGLRLLFGSLRDVRRFSNALPAAVELIGDEVELSDVLALEALRLFEPDVFKVIADQPAALTTIGAGGFGGHDAALEAQHKQTILDLLGAASHSQPVRKLVTELFPATRRHLGGSHLGGSWEAGWRRERRVASAEVLNVYLARGLPAGVLAHGFIRALLSAFDDRQQLNEMLAELDGETLERLFARLEDYEGHFETEHPEVPVGAFLDAAPRLRTGRRGIFDSGADIALGRLVLRILRGRTPEEVERAVRAVEVNSIWARYELTLLVGHVEGAGHRLVSEEAAQSLERALTDEMLKASVEQLRRERNVAALVGMAARVDPERLRSRLTQWMEDPAFLMALLRSATLESIGGTTGRTALHRGYQLNWPALAKMVGQEVLAERVRAAEPHLEELEPDDVERQVFGQAQRYANDPDLAAAHLRRWGTTTDA